MSNEQTKLNEKMTVKKSLKELKAELMSPSINPLVEPQSIETKKRYVTSGRNDRLFSELTGEHVASSVIKTIEERDDAEFVKVFAAGVAASYELSKTAQRVFQIVLKEYQKTPMSKGFADSVNLYWFGNGIDGDDAGMSERTFMRGLRELLEKKFIHPQTPVSYWVNPALFFKGDRVIFVKEYLRKKTVRTLEEEIEEDIKKLEEKMKQLPEKTKK